MFSSLVIIFFFKELQPLKIQPIFVTFLVLKLDKSIFFKDFFFYVFYFFSNLLDNESIIEFKLFILSTSIKDNFLSN